MFFFSKWVDPACKHIVTSSLSIREGIFPFKYLGASLSPFKPRIQDQVFMLDKARSRLAGWRAHSLSQAGRLTLIQATLQAIPVHHLLSG